MWILAIIKKLCPMPKFEALKHFEVSVHSMILPFGMLYTL